MRVQIKPRLGLPTLHIDGKPFPAIAAYVRPRFLADFRDAGIHIYTSPLSENALSAARFWVGKGRYDFCEVKRVADAYLDGDPEAYLIPRVPFGYVEANWWAREYPEELARLSDGSRGYVDDHGVRRSESSGHSFASHIWRNQASEALRAFIRFMEEEYPDRILGYHIGGGVVTEWVEWNVHNRRLLGDYSRPMVENFRDWLNRRGLATGTAAAIPSPEQRMSADLFTFRDPKEEGLEVEYSRCLSETVSDVLLHLCRVAKEETNSERIVGVFYGYLWTHGETLCPQHAGHLCLRKVLESPNVDFVASPYHYDFRGLGGVNYPQTLADEVRKHGKLYMNEVDTKTFRTKPGLSWMGQIRRPRTARETVELLKRDFSFALSKGVGMWWMDLFDEGWFHSPSIGRALSRLQEVMEAAFDAGAVRVGPSQIAVVLDEDSFHYQKPVSDLASPLLSVQRQRELSRIGAPFDEVLHDELSDRHRLYAFLNTFYLTKDERTDIRRSVGGKGKACIWVYAPGFLDCSGCSTEAMTELTGIRVGMLQREASLEVATAESNHPLLRGIPCGTRFGTRVDRRYLRTALSYPRDRRVGPVFYVDDPDCEELGRIVGTARVGLAAKETDGRLSVYSAAPALPASLLRNVARHLGVHLYLETGDLVYANEGFLSIYSLSPGVKLIRLPRASDVYDPYEREQVCTGSQSFRVAMEGYCTRMFLVRPTG